MNINIPEGVSVEYKSAQEGLPKSFGKRILHLRIRTEE